MDENPRAFDPNLVFAADADEIWTNT